VLEKMTIRAPVAGTVLQVNARAGELASPSSPQLLVLLGDISQLRVRAQVAEPNIGAVKVGRSVRFVIAPSVERCHRSRRLSSRCAWAQRDTLPPPTANSWKYSSIWPIQMRLPWG
jgi:Barrel-sandwich domain of CusB or HlyD membrane-fusion